MWPTAPRHSNWTEVERSTIENISNNSFFNHSTSERQTPNDNFDWLFIIVSIVMIYFDTFPFHPFSLQAFLKVHCYERLLPLSFQVVEHCDVQWSPSNWSLKIESTKKFKKNIRKLTLSSWNSVEYSSRCSIRIYSAVTNYSFLKYGKSKRSGLRTETNEKSSVFAIQTCHKRFSLRNTHETVKPS